MLDCLDGRKKYYFGSELSSSSTLNTPEFTTEVLWAKVKDNAEFLLYIPDNLIKRPDRIPKDWLWRLITRYNPKFAEEYSAAAMKIYEDKKRKKARKKINLTPEHIKLLEDNNIRPDIRLFYAVKERAPSKNTRPAAQNIPVSFCQKKGPSD